MGNLIFSLVKCSCAKSINAHYNMIVGEKDSTCETNRRNIQLLLSIKNKCIREIKPRTLSLTETNEQFLVAIVNNARKM